MSEENENQPPLETESALQSGDAGLVAAVRGEITPARITTTTISHGNNSGSSDY